MQEQNQRTSPWLIAWRVIFTFALIGCIVFIFSNSLQIADVSEGASGRVLGILQGILRHLGLPGAADRLTMHIVRKLAHFGSHAFAAGCTWRKHRGMDGNESLAP